jgi:3-oxoadipate enol-lactonase
MLASNFRAGTLDAHITGSGRSIVFLHSLLSDRGSLEPIIPLLRSKFRLVLFDLPGFGNSDVCLDGLGAIADRLAEGIRIACPDERPLLFGNGYGAFVALALAARHPDAVNGLFLAGCGAAFSEQGRQAFRVMAAKAKEGGLASIADIAMRRLFTSEMAARFPDVVAERRSSFLATDPAVFSQACEALSTLDLRDEARKLRIPLLACAGSLDEATPPIMAEELAELSPQGSCTIIADCAHVPTLQAPEQIAMAMQSFADEIQPSV